MDQAHLKTHKNEVWEKKYNVRYRRLGIRRAAVQTQKMTVGGGESRRRRIRRGTATQYRRRSGGTKIAS